MLPTPSACNTLTTCKANALTQGCVVEASSNCCSQSIGIACRALEHGFAVCSCDFRERATIGSNEANSGAHCFNSGEAKAFIKAWNNSQLSLCIELYDALIADARDKVDCIGEAKRRNEVGAMARLWFSNNGETHIAFGAEFGECFQQV